MSKHSSGGGAADQNYSSFVNDLYDRLGSFKEVYRERRNKEHDDEFRRADPISSGVRQKDNLDDETIEMELSALEDCAITSFFGPSEVGLFVDALAPGEGLVQWLSDEDPAALRRESRLNKAIGWILDDVEWEGADAIQFRKYTRSVRTALHRQEVLIEATYALADVHARIVRRTRRDLIDLFDAAIAVLRDDGADISAVLTVASTAFAIGAAFVPGGAGVTLGVASALAGAGASFTSGEKDEVGEEPKIDFGSTAKEILETTTDAISELMKKAGEKSEDLSDVVLGLCGIIEGGGAEIPMKHLLPLQPNVARDYDPRDFYLPDYIYDHGTTCSCSCCTSGPATTTADTSTSSTGCSSTPSESSMSDTSATSDTSTTTSTSADRGDTSNSSDTSAEESSDRKGDHRPHSDRPASSGRRGNWPEPDSGRKDERSKAGEPDSGIDGRGSDSPAGGGTPNRPQTHPAGGLRPDSGGFSGGGIPEPPQTELPKESGRSDNWSEPAPDRGNGGRSNSAPPAGGLGGGTGSESGLPAGGGAPDRPDAYRPDGGFGGRDAGSGHVAGGWTPDRAAPHVPDPGSPASAPDGGEARAHGAGQLTGSRTPEGPHPLSPDGGVRIAHVSGAAEDWTGGWVPNRPSAEEPAGSKSDIRYPDGTFGPWWRRMASSSHAALR